MCFIQQCIFCTGNRLLQPMLYRYCGTDFGTDSYTDEFYICTDSITDCAFFCANVCAFLGANDSGADLSAEFYTDRSIDCGANSSNYCTHTPRNY